MPPHNFLVGQLPRTYKGLALLYCDLQPANGDYRYTTGYLTSAGNCRIHRPLVISLFCEQNHVAKKVVRMAIEIRGQCCVVKGAGLVSRACKTTNPAYDREQILFNFILATWFDLQGGAYVT